MLVQLLTAEASRRIPSKAISKSKSEGAPGMKVDLTVTKDGHVILLHDASVDRTSNSSGLIEDLTLEEVQKLQVAGSHSRYVLWFSRF